MYKINVINDYGLFLICILVIFILKVNMKNPQSKLFMRILVTGGAGYIGSHTIMDLLKIVLLKFK